MEKARRKPGFFFGYVWRSCFFLSLLFFSLLLRLRGPTHRFFRPLLKGGGLGGDGGGSDFGFSLALERLIVRALVF